MMEVLSQKQKVKTMYGPSVPFSEETHAEKYRGEGESFRDAMNRIASTLSDGPEHYADFRQTLLNMQFLPGGRIQSAIGSTKNVTAYNCFVSGTIADSFVDGEGSIMERATEAAATMRMGGGIGYDFSPLRPRGALIRKLQSKSSGPISFMEIFNAVCKCVASSGHRRGAQMGVLRVDHPDIEEFIHAKNNGDRFTGFNLSIGITDEFMIAVIEDTSFDLRWGGEVYRTINARALWETIMRSTWDWAEPGVIFIDRVNQYNNLHYCEDIAATNPCGEQPLPPYGACLLGSFNLTRFILPRTVRSLGSGRWKLDHYGLQQAVWHAVRAMDNVIDRTTYPLEAQKREAQSKRRMGLGVTGAANAIEALLGGPSYGSPEYLEQHDRILQLITVNAYRASVELAKEKGAFPLFDKDKFTASRFIQDTLPGDLIEDIYKYGIRNSHLTSIAPTGTISLTADNVSSGIEPVFAYSYDRTKQTFNGPVVETVEDYGMRVFGIKGKRANDVTAQEHVSVLASAQRWVDSAVSKTCNVPPTMSWEDFKNVYLEAWKQGAKGCTTFNSGGKRFGILVSKDEGAETSEAVLTSTDTDTAAEQPAEACYFDPATGRRECA